MAFRTADSAAGDVELRSVYGWADPLGSAPSTGSGPREVQKVRTETYGTSGSQTFFDDEGHVTGVSFSKYSGTGTYSGTNFINYQTERGCEMPAWPTAGLLAAAGQSAARSL